MHLLQFFTYIYTPRGGPREQICLPVDNWPLFPPRTKELLLPSVLSERSMCPWRSGRGCFEISEASRFERKSF